MGKKYNVVFNSLENAIEINGVNTTKSRLQYNINWASFLPKNDGKKYRCTFNFKSYADNTINIYQNLMISMNLGKNYIYQNSRQSNIIGTVSSHLNGVPFSITSRGTASQIGGNEIIISNLEGFISDNTVLTFPDKSVEITSFVSGTRGYNGTYSVSSGGSYTDIPFYGTRGASVFYSCVENDNPSFDIEYPQNNEVIIEILNFNNRLLRNYDLNEDIGMYFTLDYVLILQLEEI